MYNNTCIDLDQLEQRTDKNSLGGDRDVLINSFKGYIEVKTLSVKLISNVIYNGSTIKKQLDKQSELCACGTREAIIDHSTCRSGGVESYFEVP